MATPDIFDRPVTLGDGTVIKPVGSDAPVDAELNDLLAKAGLIPAAESVVTVGGFTPSRQESRHQAPPPMPQAS